MNHAIPVATLILLTAPLARAQQGLQLTTGVDGGVTVPADPLLVPPTGITVEAWVTYDDSTIPTGLFYWPTIARQNIVPNAEVYNFRVSASNNNQRNLQFIVRAAGVLQAVSYTFAPGEFVNFTHLAATYDGQNMAIYKNGVQVATRVLPSINELIPAGGVLRIGNGDPAAPGNESWNGIIDELRIWPMARTAAEITATMNQSFFGLPGGALMFPLDGHTIEVNHALIGTLFGTTTFVNGAPTVGNVVTSVAATGQSTSTCPRLIESTVGSLPAVGNSAFALWATGGPRPAVAPLGVIVAAGATAPIGQPPLFGVAFAFDATRVLSYTVMLPPTGILGNARFGLPLPNNANFVGARLVFQFGFFDSTCGPQGLTASDGVVVTIQ